MASINSIDELKRIQAASQENGKNVTNYSEWLQILTELNSAGIKPTGDFNSDKQLLAQITQQKQDQTQQMQDIPQVTQNKRIQPQHNDMNKMDFKTANDEEQRIKAEVANQTSSKILENYNRYLI